MTDVIATSGWVSISNMGNNVIGDMVVDGSLGKATNYNDAVSKYGTWTLYVPDEDTSYAAFDVIDSDTYDEGNSVIESIGVINGKFVWDANGDGGSGWYTKQ